MSPEHWTCDAGGDSVALLVIPAALHRTRTFDLDATLWVQVPAGAHDAWHELTVEVDGRRQWARRIPSHNPGETDSLEYHCRLTIEPDQECRVRAKAAVRGVRVQRLLVEAREGG